MYNKKVILLLLFLLFLIPASYGIEPISRTDEIIRTEHEKTRQWCLDVCEAKVIELKDTYKEEKDKLVSEYKTAQWIDRLTTSIIIFCSMIIAGAFNSYLNLKKDRRLRQLEKEKKLYDSPAPKPTKRYKNGFEKSNRKNKRVRKKGY